MLILHVRTPLCLYSRLPEMVNNFVRRPLFTILRLFTITDAQQTQARQLLELW